MKVIRDFGQSYNLHEKTTARTLIVKVDCYAPGDRCICNVDRMDPPGGPFIIWLEGSSVYWVYYVGVSNGGALSYKAVPTYMLTIKCVNGPRNESDFADLEIDIIPNADPVITNSKYPHDVTSIVARDFTVPGTDVYTVHAKDEDGDVLTCSMTTRPPVNYFTIVKSGPSTGGTTDCIIKTAVDLRLASEPMVTLQVTISDGRTTTNNFDIDVNIALNTRPQILNLPITVSIPETTPSGFTIATLTVQDPDVFVPQMVPTCTVAPISEQYKFSFETGSHKIRLSNLPNGAPPLDYETTNLYTITCTVTDGFLESENEILTVKVTNVNEPPMFDEIAYYCDLDESEAGGSSCDLNAIITDPEGDTIPSVGFLNGNNSNRFRYDWSTSAITFNVNYDVDQNAMPDNVVLQLQASDVYGASKTAPVYIRVHDVNDNTCNFGSTSTHTFRADQGTPLGSLGSFKATDEDRTSPNNLVTYEVIRALPSDSTNYIAAYGDGSLAYIGFIPEVNHGTTYTLIVRCKDGGSPQRTAEATVALTYQTTTTTSTTTTTTSTRPTPAPTTPTTPRPPSHNPFDYDAFVAVFALLVLVLAGALLAGVYALWRFCGAAGATGAGAAEGGLFGSNFCCPKNKVEQDDYFTYDVRTNNDYRDSYWKTGDHYESGNGYNAAGDPYSKVIEGGAKRLALPAPPARPNLTF